MCSTCTPRPARLRRPRRAAAARDRSARSRAPCTRPACTGGSRPASARTSGSPSRSWPPRRPSGSRLARDIHDGISQRLVSLSYHLDAALTHLDRADPGPARADIDTACGLVDTTMGEARAAIGALRPPVLDDLGLAGALAALARDLPGVTTSLALDDVDLPDHVEIALYRIAQEALQNVVKHAAANRVTVRLGADPGGVRLAVTDDGVGFTPSSTGRVPSARRRRFRPRVGAGARRAHRRRGPGGLAPRRGHDPGCHRPALNPGEFVDREGARPDPMIAPRDPGPPARSRWRTVTPTERCGARGPVRTPRS